MVPAGCWPWPNPGPPVFGLSASLPGSPLLLEVGDWGLCKAGSSGLIALWGVVVCPRPTPCAAAVAIPQSTTAAANVELKYVRITSSFSALGKCLERALVPHALQSPSPRMVQSRKSRRVRRSLFFTDRQRVTGFKSLRGAPYTSAVAQNRERLPFSWCLSGAASGSTPLGKS